MRRISILSPESLAGFIEINLKKWVREALSRLQDGSNLFAAAAGSLVIKKSNERMLRRDVDDHRISITGVCGIERLLRSLVNDFDKLCRFCFFVLSMAFFL